jgi:hypothetical protein
MNLTNEERNALVSIRMQKAKEALLETKGILELGYWRAASNRFTIHAFMLQVHYLLSMDTRCAYTCRGYQPDRITFC